MKNLVFIFVVIFALSSCSFYSKKSNADADYKEEKNLSDDTANQITESNFAQNANETASDQKLLEAKRILKKKINKNTFEEDIKIIQKANLYDSSVCASLKSNVLISEGYTSPYTRMTYQTALDASKEGKERARRIENL